MVAEQDADTAKDRAPVSSSLQFLPSIIGETSRRDETELSQAVSEHTEAQKYPGEPHRQPGQGYTAFKRGPVLHA